ncbi:MAG: rRNA pseudouridine synthase [Clostridia bacterium]|nr:rRNA pseudouridine synthase [Clostridia bacterium]
MQEKLIRIQKYIADCGVCSRRAAEAMIEAGRVTLNGKPVQLGDKTDGSKDLVRIDGKVIKPQTRNKTTIMLYKPRGYVTTMSDEQGRKCVADLIRKERIRLYPVGRLDKDSEGLLLLTNDGELANKLTHPANNIPKTYRVIVRGAVHREHIKAFETGIYIAEDDYTTRSAEIEILEAKEDRTVFYLTLYEGKNREIRKMCEVLGLEVLRLKRDKLADLSIGTLRAGQYRALSQKELDYLYSL